MTWMVTGSFASGWAGSMLISTVRSGPALVAPVATGVERMNHANMSITTPTKREAAMARPAFGWLRFDLIASFEVFVKRIDRCYGLVVCAATVNVCYLRPLRDSHSHNWVFPSARSSEFLGTLGATS